tara:strand:+ start:25 stop:804 length:780 start_codon:yes stop_codon:yes gene_type:complete
MLRQKYKSIEGKELYNYVRTTNKNRLKEVDKELLIFLKENNISKLDFLEVAGSNFITTNNTINTLKKNNIEVVAHCSDINVFAYKYSFNFFTFIFTNERQIIYIYFFKYRIIHPSRKLLKIFLIHSFFNFIQSRITKIFKDYLPKEKINLAIPEIQQDEKNKFFEDDITVYNPNFEKKFDLIRVAHCLSEIKTGNFELFKKAILNLKRYLKDNKSFLLVVSNDIHGTIFSLNELGNFYIVKRINNGCVTNDLEKDIIEI